MNNPTFSVDTLPLVVNSAVETFHQALQGLIAGKRLSFSYTACPDTPLSLFLRDHLGGEIFTIDDANITYDAQKCLNLKGTVSNELLGAPNLLLDFYFYSTEAGLAVYATLSRFPTDWKLSSAFADLAESLHDSFTFHNVQFVLDSTQESLFTNVSFRKNLGYEPLLNDVELIDKKKENISFFRKGWSFSGVFLINQLPTAYQWLLQDEEHTIVNLQGPIHLVGEQTEFYLQSLPGKSFTAFNKAFPLHFGLASIRKEKLTTTLFSDYFLDDFVQIYCPEAFEIKGVKALLGSKSYYLTSPLLSLRASFGDGLPVQVNDILSLVDAGPLLDEIKDLAGDFTLTLHQIGLDIDLHNKTIQGGKLAISSDAQLQLHEQFKLSGLDLHLNTGFRQGSHSIYAKTKLTLFERQFNVGLFLPSKSYEVVMIDEQEIELDALFSQLQLPPLDVFAAVNCTSLQFSGNIAAHDYAIAIGLESNTVFRYQDISLQLKSAYIGVSKNNGWQFSVSGEIALGPYSCSYYLAKAGDGWQVSIELLDSAPIPLTDILQHLASQLPLPVLPIIPAIEVSAFQLNYNTASKAVNFDAQTSTALTIELANSSQSFDTTIHLESNDNNQLEGQFLSVVTLGENNIQLKFSLQEINRTLSFSWTNQEQAQFNLISVLDFIGVEDILPLPQGFDLAFTSVSLHYDTQFKRLTIAALTNEIEFFYTWQKGQGAAASSQVLGMNLPYTKLSQVQGFSSLSFADSISFDQLSLLNVKGNLQNYHFPVLPPVLAQDDNQIEQGEQYAPIRPSFGDSELDLIEGVSFVIGLKVADISHSGIQPLLNLLPVNRLTLQVQRTATSLIYFTQFSTSTAINLAGLLAIEVDELAFSLTLSSLPSEKPLLGLEGQGSLSLLGQTLAGRLRIDGNQEQTRGALQTDPEQVISLPAPFSYIRLIAPGVSLESNLVEKSLSVGVQGKLKFKTSSKVYDFAAVMQTIGGVTRPQYLSFFISEFRIEDLWLLFLNGMAIPRVISNLLSLIDCTGENVCVYWCDTPVQLPDGTQGLPGFQLGGLLNLYGFDIYGKFVMRDTSLGESHFQLDPLTLPFMQVTGAGEDVYQVNQANKKVKVVTKGGPVFVFNATSLPIVHGSVDLALFDINFLALEAIVDQDGLEMEAAIELLGADMNLAVQVALPPTVHAKVQGATTIDLSDIVIEVKTSGVSVLVILDLAQVDIALDIQGGLSGYTAKASIKAQVLGQQLDFDVNINVNSNLTAIDKFIEEQLINQVQGIFEQLASNAKQLMQTLCSPQRLLAASPVKLFVFELDSFNYKDLFLAMTQKSLPSGLNSFASSMGDMALYGTLATKRIKTPKGVWVNAGFTATAKLSLFQLQLGARFSYVNGFLGGYFQLKPIELKPVFSLKGNTRELAVISPIDKVKHRAAVGGGPLAGITSRGGILTATFTLLGISKEIKLAFNDTISFDLSKSIFGTQIHLASDFTFSRLQLQAEASFDIQLTDIKFARRSYYGSLIGYLSVDPVVTVQMVTFANPSEARTTFNCAFEVMGQRISHSFTLSTFSDINKLKDVLSVELAKLPIDLFEDMLKDPRKIIGLVQSGAGTLIRGNLVLNPSNITGSAEILKDVAQLNFNDALRGVSRLVPGNLKPEDALNIGKDLFRESPQHIISGMKDVINLNPKDAIKTLQSLGLSTLDAAELAEDLYKLGPEAATKLLAGSLNVGVEVAGDVLKSVYRLDYKKAGPMLKDIGGYSVDAVSDVLQGTFGASKKAIGSIGGAFKSIGGSIGGFFGF